MILYIFLRSLPKISEEDFELIFSELDDSGDFKVKNFLYLASIDACVHIFY